MRRRRRRVVCAVAFAGAAALGAAACDPVDGGMNSAAVAITVDQMGTKELERQHLDVLWLSCTATFKDKVTPSSGAEPRDTVATVDCQGQAKEGKGPGGSTHITIKGKVWKVVDERCVRGDLTARVGGKEWFRVDVLGDCSGGGNGNGSGSGNGSGGGGGGGDSSATPEPPASHQPPGPTVTVTVTADPPPRPPDPTCSCFQGK
ncbi:hypothetical protein ACGFSB_02305 [Streptomyces sp. NPDC048441]|uniref:hypothetical protein n=1 Tax=Streptomyces sp. NPDC048441 TaxID=3365552 RepID=UPI003710D1F5